MLARARFDRKQNLDSLFVWRDTSYEVFSFELMADQRLRLQWLILERITYLFEEGRLISESGNHCHGETKCEQHAVILQRNWGLVMIIVGNK